MKTRDIKELQTKTEGDIRKMLSEAKTALTEARLEHAQRKLTNTTGMAILRRDIARMQTILRSKSMQKVEEEASVPKGGKA
jgi:ribosomal protein L29